MNELNNEFVQVVEHKTYWEPSRNLGTAGRGRISTNHPPIQMLRKIDPIVHGI
jgi:hypothetical protein